MSHSTRRIEPDDEMKENIEKHNRGQICSECHSNTLITSPNGRELVCETCGLVVEERSIDHGPEWRAFTHRDRQQKARVGTPTTPTKHDRGLTTTIDWKDKDASGHTLSAEKRKQMHRLRTWQERIRAKNANERNLQFALGEIDRMASALGIPRSVREIACVLYRHALNDDLIKGRSIEGVTTSCLYAACRSEMIPRSLEEVSAVSRVERTEIGRAYRYIAWELGLKIEPTDPHQYIPRLCSELSCSNEIKEKANEIIDVAINQGLLSGRSPVGVAAAAIYGATLLCKGENTQAEIADVANISQMTVRKRYQEQMSALNRSH
ncbi:transcription initiation factor IIB 3 [Haladaptatus sp. R4]|uniref:transcription initiation factor IIB n=1 Tax=Haladaptatus sp. R4 TaxID=1679489 RepID=UPI0007B4F3A5|nr:transcription initiation factor IIB [Haladaptatus sp. R4]KZN23139.1 transcription initiation factor IIB 3 [Haladaptatus sp. R4]